MATDVYRKINFTGIFRFTGKAAGAIVFNVVSSHFIDKIKSQYRHKYAKHVPNKNLVNI